MLRKFKILMFFIVLFLIGIITVISIWLYGSYRDHLEMVTNEVERSLFYTVQNYYENQDNSIELSYKRSNRSGFNASVVRNLLAVYPQLDSNRIKEALDFVWFERYSKHHNVKTKSDSVRSRTIVPPYVLQQLSFNEESLAEVDSLLTAQLLEKGIHFEVQVVREQLPQRSKGRGPKLYVDSLGKINTRPILVNPTNAEYLIAKFNPPVLFVFSKMFWQLAVAFLLIVGLIGAFVYLFWTINIQNKIALLRKSFVSNMTHELKTPVAIVMAAIEAVQRYGAKDNKEKMDKYLQISHHEMVHLSNMIEKVLQLNIDEVSGIVLHRTSFDLLDLISEVAETSKIGAKGIVNFNLQFPKNAISLFADLAHLKNVFSNLFDNAIKYARADAQIDVEVKKKGKFVLIEVTDNGLGIAENYQKDIFEMFFRVPAGDRHDVKGFGLGLAYVKLVVEQHGGTIKVNSVLNKGTTFVVSIPQ